MTRKNSAFFPFFFFLFFILSTYELQGETSAPFKKDFTDSLTWLLHGSYRQFQSAPSWGLIATGGTTLGYALKKNSYHDKRITFHHMQKGKMKGKVFVESLAILSTFPLFPLAFYYVGYKKEDTKLIQFSKEFFAASNLTLIESALISFIDVHERPRQDKINFFEKNFRGKSSFPSGHLVPMAALSFKTLQFYGPLYAITPFLFTGAISYERIRSGKHYFSDVVGSFFLAGMASEGVRLSAMKESGVFLEHYHPLFQKIAKRELTFLPFLSRDRLSFHVALNY
jgi:membrane-associated phospholipid phosphatase